MVNKLKDDVNKGLLPMDFIILNTDVDEIPEPKVVEELRPGGMWHADVMKHARKLDMKFFYFKHLFWKSSRLFGRKENP